mgnify:CR=1 FL=1
MKDPRLETLARQLIRYSCALKPGERVLIENFGVEPEAVTALIREAYAAGAEPIVILRDMRVQRALMLGATAEKWDEEARVDADRMRAVDAYIACGRVQTPTSRPMCRRRSSACICSITASLCTA